MKNKLLDQYKKIREICDDAYKLSDEQWKVKYSEVKYYDLLESQIAEVWKEATSDALAKAGYGLVAISSSHSQLEEFINSQKE